MFKKILKAWRKFLDYCYWEWGVELTTPFDKNKEHCDECNEDYYVCEICGCEYDNATSANLCRDWDRILGKNRHSHHFPHDHEEEK